MTAYAFGVALELLCGRFVVLSRQNWLQTMFEPRHICWHIQIIDPWGLRSSLSAFCDISVLTSFLIPSPVNTRVHTQYEE